MEVHNNINPIEFSHIMNIRNEVKKNFSRDEAYEILLAMEDSLNFVKSTIYDNPFYSVVTSTKDVKKDWILKTNAYSISEHDRKFLFDNGFSILNRKLLGRKSLIDMFENLNVDSDDLILDKDYGLIIFPEDSFKKNFYLGMAELSRYGDSYPSLKERLSNIFSIGALRAHALLNQKIDYTPIQIEIKNRCELTALLSTINSKLIENRSRFKVWFRGQSSEHSLKKISNPQLLLCPWRAITDASLVPSLYRNSDNIYDDLNSYTHKLLEILEIERALNIHLNIPKYESRSNDTEEIMEYFKNSVWEDSNSPYSWAYSTGKEILEIHDYNPIYRALQTSLFLQHYGIPTNILDITKDIDVALFFAQMKSLDGTYTFIENFENSVIYLFLLDPRTDRFIDSSELLQKFGVQRPLRQKCGIIAGASFANQNYYSRFISIRIKLSSFIDFNKEYSSEYLFPSQHDDTVLDFLNKFGKQKKIKHVKAF